MSGKKIFTTCLYFTANSLARAISKLAEEEFKITGISPSHAFLMMLVLETPGISPGQLSSKLNLAPSTITRFLDFLVMKGYISRESEGKNTQIFPTGKGKALELNIANAWKSLHENYSSKLGKEWGNNLAKSIHEASKKL